MDVNISSSAYVLSHKHGESFGATVYSFGVRVGQGYVAGINQKPVACKSNNMYIYSQLLAVLHASIFPSKTFMPCYL